MSTFVKIITKVYFCKWSGTYAVNSALLLFVVRDFAMLHIQRLFAGNSLNVKCHATLK